MYAPRCIHFLLYLVATPYFISFITAQIINRNLRFLITCIDSYRQLFWGLFNTIQQLCLTKRSRSVLRLSPGLSFAFLNSTKNIPYVFIRDRGNKIYQTSIYKLNLGAIAWFRLGLLIWITESYTQREFIALAESQL